mmetsp:Transcript_4294/g.8200  ORF Transcript_4294/g.8200 Transcript_4294/m.8200 type:complete len:228 (+) Transcript_4294:57-740(+)
MFRALVSHYPTYLSAHTNPWKTLGSKSHMPSSQALLSQNSLSAGVSLLAAYQRMQVARTSADLHLMREPEGVEVPGWEEGRESMRSYQHSPPTFIFTTHTTCAWKKSAAADLPFLSLRPAIKLFTWSESRMLPPEAATKRSWERILRSTRWSCTSEGMMRAVGDRPSLVRMVFRCGPAYESMTATTASSDTPPELLRCSWTMRGAMTVQPLVLSPLPLTRPWWVSRP